MKEFIQATQVDLGESDTGKMVAAFLSEDNAKDKLSEVEMYNVGTGETMEPNVTNKTLECFESMAIQTTISLRHGLLRLIEDQTRNQKMVTKKGRRLAKGKSHRLLVGDMRIFKRKWRERDTVDCDLVVLADSSGSMGVNIEDVKIATYALLDCLDRIEGANTSAYAFGVSDDAIVELKNHNERFDNLVKAKIASLRADGGTPAAQAYWCSAHSLFRMQGKKKIVVMITDGQPDSPKAAKEMVETLERNGITVICLGVGRGAIIAAPILDYVYGINRWLKVEKFDLLPNELIRVAKEVI
ncbi:VWA domain-containing protein [Vibrio sp. 1180_3]|nr:VWA domain-containing protein [Vibrio sp. 1180_3]